MSDSIETEHIESTEAADTLLAVASSYKVRGKFTDGQGAGVVGQNDAGSGTPLGVQGAVPNSADGFGLATPDDARIEGDIESSSGHALTVGGVPTLRLGPEGTDGGGDPAGGNVVAGLESNSANNAAGATISGGGNASLNGDPNSVTDNFGTVGGGHSNTAGDAQSGTTSAVHATVGGGQFNEASGENSTVGGGTGNKATALAATVAGGDSNGATDRWATIAGGSRNLTSSENAFIGSGSFNQADGSDSVIAGGENNTTIGPFSAIGGGADNRTGTSGTAFGFYATIPGGRSNLATEDYTFAAGRQAKAEHAGAFVWADSTDASVSSSGEDQFIVEAGGGVGIGETDPRTQLHVSYSNNGSNIENHTALIEDTNDSSSRALAVKIGDSSPTDVDHYITFYDADDNYQGAIEGTGSGTVQLDGTTADYGEYMPKRESTADIEAADVVGVVDGEITKRTTEAGQALVVSDRSIVTGNSPGPDPADRADHEVCAFVGQVPVKVRGPVDAGDLLVPSGEHDGTAQAVDPTAYRPSDGPLIGRAWEGSDTAGVHRVTVAVGIEAGDVLGPALRTQREELQAENERLREQLEAKDDRIEVLESETEQLRERLAALEERVTTLDTGGTATPADD